MTCYGVFLTGLQKLESAIIFDKYSLQYEGLFVCIDPAIDVIHTQRQEPFYTKKRLATSVYFVTRFLLPCVTVVTLHVHDVELFIFTMETVYLIWCLKAESITTRTL